MHKQIDRLLAAVRDQQLLACGRSCPRRETSPSTRASTARIHPSNRAAELAGHRCEARSSCSAGIPPPGKISSRGPRLRERNRSRRNVRHQAAQPFFAALVGEKRFPSQVAAAVAIRARRRRELLHGHRANIRSAPHVTLNQAFGFEFGVSIRHRGSVNAEVRGQFAARRNAISGAQSRPNAPGREAGRAIARTAEYGFRAVNGVAALARSCRPIYSLQL